MVKRIRTEAVKSPALYRGDGDDGRQSSRIATGKKMLPLEDGRSVWARLQKSTYRALIGHCGGDRLVNDMIRIACRRCATLEAELVMIEDRIARLRRQRKEPPHSLLHSYASLTSQQMRLSKALGWDRHAKPINDEPKDLQSYLASKSNGHRNGRAALTIEHEDA